MRNFNFRMKLNNKFRFMNTGIKLTVLLSTCCLSLSAQENSFNVGIRLGGGATHTFLVVAGDNGKVLRYAAYGPQNGNPIGGDKLTECH